MIQWAREMLALARREFSSLASRVRPPNRGTRWRYSNRGMALRRGDPIVRGAYPRWGHCRLPRDQSLSRSYRHGLS